MPTETELQLLQQLIQPPALDACRKVLCVQPHPDDNEIGMGGIVAKLAAGGVQVDYLTVTDGALGDQGLHDRSLSLAEVRRAEAEAAGRLLGVTDFHWLDLPDGGLDDVAGLARQVAAIIRAGRYDAVFCPDPWCAYEAHWDHVVCGRAVAYAALIYDLGQAADNATLKAVGFYFTASPNTVVDVSAHFPAQLQALAAHRSQVSPETLQLYTGYLAWRGQQLTGSEAIGQDLKMLSPLHLHCIPEAGAL